MIVVVLVVLCGWVIAGAAWDQMQRRSRDLDERERHASLMREIDGHADEPRWRR